VQTGIQSEREAGVTRNREDKPTSATDARKLTSERDTVRDVVVAEDDPGAPTRQPSCGRQRIR
jgi:hypothetical protein